MQQPHRRRVIALALCLALPGILVALRLDASGGGHDVFAWWLLAPAFALADVVALRLRPAGRLVGAALTTAPLIVGLLLASPVDVMAGRVLAATLVGVIWRDRPVPRIGLDAALVAAVTAAAQAVFTLLANGADLTGDRERALAAVLGGTVAALVDTVVVTMVANRSAASVSGAERVRSLLACVAGAGMAGVAGVGLVTLVPPEVFRAQSALVTVVLVGVLTVERVAQSLADRRQSLERLRRLSDAMVRAHASTDVVSLLLAQSLELVGARYAEVVLDAPDLPVAGVDESAGRSRWVLRAGVEPTGPGPDVDPPAETLPGFATLLADPSTGYVVVTRDVPADRAFLSARGLTEAVLVLLRSEERPIGHVLVGDRRVGSLAPTAVEGRLLQIVANHASEALRTGRLIHRLHVEARQDELTGLPNRLQLRELLDAAAERSASGGPSCAVMVLDLNGFKAINDTLGHQAGDELLQVLAARLAEAAADRATVARLGGDEFSVLSTVCGEPESARDLAVRLLTAFAEPVLVSGARLRVGGSIGVALGPDHGRTGSDLLRHADIAMYAAKASGGGHRLFAPDLVELTASGLTLATDLRDAIDRGEISVVAQPLVDLVTDELHSVEVLARWQHPDLGEVPPEQFFAAAERSGQVQALSACVLDHALALSRRCLDAGLRLRVAVNLAARWLSEPTLPEQVGAALARHGVAADLLCLELTERSVIADPRRVNETLARLRSTGVHLSVDDFGTGYSSLTYLSRLPVDQMKIDKSFVSELDASERDRAIVRSMIDLGRNLGLEVVAEGVSTASARQVLADLGCRLGQGYLIARPVDPEDLLQRLAAPAGSTASGAAAGPVGVPVQRAQLRGSSSLPDAVPGR
jgi:diguanylate cyclase (GGDEF)-like protein